VQEVFLTLLVLLIAYQGRKMGITTPRTYPPVENAELRSLSIVTSITRLLEGLGMIFNVTID